MEYSAFNNKFKFIYRII